MNRNLALRACALLPAALLLGACTMIPEYERPPLPVADSFAAEAAPPANGQAPASVTFGPADGRVLLKYVGEVQGQNPGVVVNPRGLSEEVNVRIAVDAGDAGLAIPESTITFYDHHCEKITVYLPSIELFSGERLPRSEAGRL